MGFPNIKKIFDERNDRVKALKKYHNKYLNDFYSDQFKQTNVHDINTDGKYMRR